MITKICLVNLTFMIYRFICNIRGLDCVAAPAAPMSQLFENNLN